MPIQDSGLGFFVCQTQREALLTVLPPSSVLSGMPLAMLKVLASGRGYRQGGVLSFPTITPICEVCKVFSEW